MRSTATYLTIILAGLSGIVLGSKAPASSGNYPPAQTAKLLSWQPSINGPCNLCKGTFVIPENIKRHPHPLNWHKLPTRITATGPTKLTAKGITILNDHVVVSQPGRLVKADHAYVYRDKHQQVVWIKLIGHVSLREPDRLLVGTRAQLDLKKHTAIIYHAAYYLRRYHTITTKYHGSVASWGTAKVIYQRSDGTIVLQHAIYSTCSPLNPAWQLVTSKLTLNQQAGFGHAKNIRLNLKSVPIFYFPYFTFPINNKRKSGFLYPTVGYSNQRGVNAKIPIYWNMAPNYDSTWTFWPMSNRGILVSSLFRYLSQRSHLELYAGFIPADAGFNTFRQDQISKYTPIPAGFGPYIDDLQNDSNNRAYLSLHDHIRFNSYWSADADINYVTDDYYFNDFGVNYGTVAANQLYNQLDIQYKGENWNVLALAQAYQTLHLLPQINSIVSLNQYTRAPEIDIGALYPDTIAGLKFSLDTSTSNFLYHSAFNPQTFTKPVGWRIHARPGVSRPFNFATGYFTPSIYLDNTDYFSALQTPTAGMTRPQFNASRNIPIVNVDSGLYMDRHFNFNHHGYLQTLEPRLYYLYVPFVKQSKYPNFDGQELPFDFPQLFILNRYSGFDRLQNANQISLGLTSRILRGYDSTQKLKADLGVIYYFSRPRVTLPGVNLPPDERWSPLVGDLSYSPTPNWSLTSSAAIDIEEDNVNNADFSLSYHIGHNKVANIGYEFVQTVDGISIGPTNLIHVGAAWPLSKHFSGLGYLYYDFHRNLPLTYFAGLQYDTCCIAVRAIVARSFTGVETNSAGNPLRNLYSTSYYVQIMFKGLGDVGNADPSSLISQGIPNYFNPFR